MLDTIDNNDVRRVICIKVLGGSHRRYAGIGNIIKVTVREAVPHGKIEKGQVMAAVVVRTKHGVCRTDGSIIRFDGSTAVLLDDRQEPISTRIFGPMTRGLRTEKFMKIISLAPEVLQGAAVIQKTRRDGEVIIVAGRDKGKRGKILKVLADDRLVVSGVNLIKRYTKSNPMLSQQGDIAEKRTPLHVFNVVIFDTETSKANRADFKVEDGKKTHVLKSTQKPVQA